MSRNLSVTVVIVVTLSFVNEFWTNCVLLCEWFRQSGLGCKCKWFACLSRKLLHQSDALLALEKTNIQSFETYSLSLTKGVNF